MITKSWGALVLTLTLAACGGGGGGSSASSGTGGNAVAASPSVISSSMQAAIAPTTQYETITVTPTAGGTTITTSPALTKANGSPVQTLLDLPEGIANSAWMKQSTGRLPLKVVLSNGTYYLNGSWTWTPSQSGTADAPITIEAQTAGKVIISGAKDVTVTRATHGGVAKVVTDLSPYGITNLEQLWVNGGRAVRARAPNLGSFFYVQKQVTTWAGSSTYGSDPVNEVAFGADPASLAYLNGLTAAQKSAAVLVAAQSWTTSHHRIQEWNSNNEVRVSPAANWPFLWGKFGFAQRYFIENVPTALDAPLEWYFDSATQKLSYMPTDAQKQVDQVYSLPRVNQLLVLKGQASAGQWVQYLNFNGLTFRYAHLPLPSAGFVDGQAAVYIDAAVQLDGVRNASISNCEVSHVGGYAIWLRNNVRNVSVSGCEIYDTGAGGIKVGLPVQVADANATGYDTISNNRIHATGYQFPGAVGVWVGQSANNTVAGNLIGDTTYSGISVGWTWGYGTSPAHDNTVARNFLYNIVQGSLSDAGGIYTLGVSPGTTVTGNVVKNVRGFSQYGAGAWGLYNDEGSSNIVLDSNIVVGTDSGGYVMNYGLNDTVSNNIFAQGDHAELQVTKSESTLQVAFNRNYLVPNQASFVVYGSTPSPIATYTGNQISPQNVTGISSPSVCGSGCSVGASLSLQTGGLLDVPVLSNGGSLVALPSPVTGSWTGTALSAVPSSPGSWWAVPPAAIPPRVFQFDASTVALGTTPSGMSVVPAAHPELVSVIRNSAGEQCLGLQDSAGLTNAWEPYGLVATNYASGTTTETFTLKADASTEFINEFRDYAGSPYKSGPRIAFSASQGGVLVGGQRVANFPIGQWITVTVTVHQGTNATWGMQIKYADNSTVSLSGYAPYTPGWTATNAVFFVSNATTTSTPCIGKISISNQ